jgi:hypothetical protein
LRVKFIFNRKEHIDHKVFLCDLCVLCG